MFICHPSGVHRFLSDILAINISPLRGYSSLAKLLLLPLFPAELLAVFVEFVMPVIVLPKRFGKFVAAVPDSHHVKIRNIGGI